MVYRLIHKEEGYTLVEILVTLAILSVVLSLVSISFIFVSGRMAAWDNQISFYNNFHIVNDQLYNDLFRAEAMAYTDTTLNLELSGDLNRTYSWTQGTLKINAIPFLAERDSVWISIKEQEMRGKDFNTITYHLLLNNAGRMMEDSAVIRIRKPIKWEPLD